jgi:DNA-binding transcriptional MerR regulator
MVATGKRRQAPANASGGTTPERPRPARSSRPLRPVDLGRAIGLSAEMARRYERWGYLPAAERSATGRRLYGPRHLHAILAAREMRAGYGWKAALRILQLLHRGDLPTALANVDECHAALHRRRLEVEETLRALQTLTAAGALERPALRTRAAARDAPLRIGDAARRAGVRVSAVRFWEEQGLLQPQRDTWSGYRVYDDRQLLRLQVVAVLRRAGYRFDAIRAVLDELAAGRPASALSAVERRRQELAAASERCSRATAAFWSYAAEVFGRPAPLTAALIARCEYRTTPSSNAEFKIEK